ncbi:MAG: methyltransferase domain-containing protein [Cyclobacteriaceae bacterium]|nr:methyltransferase domain-containing protein [Flavobacteriaceae bacterium]MCB0491769.1 methyltransferase domain-containing protein [Cyclobacteriaceae bacterium]
MIDHSLTYRRKTLRNIPHILRLEKILGLVKELSPKKGDSLADIGCSNGYITEMIHQKFELGKCAGFDHTLENIELASKRYPGINFHFIDLNVPLSDEIEGYKIVTCFETLEHVGNLRQAIENILSFGRPGTKIIISVPIEIGAMGIMKFLIKTFILNYSLEELPGPITKWAYFMDLIKGSRMSKYRDQREGWGTHFGFDYREVDDVLNKMKIQFNAFNSFSTRFYII